MRLGTVVVMYWKVFFFSSVRHRRIYARERTTIASIDRAPPERNLGDAIVPRGCNLGGELSCHRRDLLAQLAQKVRRGLSTCVRLNWECAKICVWKCQAGLGWKISTLLDVFIVFQLLPWRKLFPALYVCVCVCVFSNMQAFVDLKTKIS